MRVIGFLCVNGQTVSWTAVRLQRVHSLICIIWPNSEMQAGVALSIMLACIWTYASNQIGTNCTAGPR
jgi:hypothetical protein